MQELIFRMTDRLIHPSIREGDQETIRKARLNIIFSAVLLMTAVIYAAATFIVEEYIATVILAVGIFTELCNLVFLRMTGRLFLSGIFLTAILMMVICGLSFFWGGYRAPGLMWLIFVSIIGTNLSGKKAGYIWLFITLLCVLFFYLLDMYGFEFPNLLNDKNYRYMRLLILLGAITVTWMLIIIYEITKNQITQMYKEAKEEIREREQMFDTILSASPFGIGLLKNRTVEWGNDALIRMFGLDTACKKGWSSRQLYPDEDEYNRVGKMLYEKQENAFVRTVDAKMIRKNGEIFDSFIILSPVDPTDISCGFILAVMDITERKKAEAEIKRLNKELSQRIFIRTMKLKSAEEELIRKQHKSELADMTTGTLHNVKNILNSVKVSTEMLNRIYATGSIRGLRIAGRILEDHKDNMEDFLLNNPKGKKLIEYYLKLGDAYNAEENESLKHLKRLQEKVAAIEKIVTAQQNYAGRSQMMESVSLENLIEDALIMHADALNTQHINIIKEFNNAHPIMGIKIKLMHIFINLIKNAKESMQNTPASERKLIFKTGKTDGYVCVNIEDSGCGIPSEAIKNLFQHGYTTKENGHGFGLYSCYQYMKEIGGNITVKSDGPGKGTTFFLSFPVEQI